MELVLFDVTTALALAVVFLTTFFCACKITGNNAITDIAKIFLILMF